MRKIFPAALLISILLVCTINGFSEEKSTHVSEAFKYSAQAAKNLIYSIGHSAAASGQIVSAVASTPFAVVGTVSRAVGQVSTKTGTILIDIAKLEPGQSLEISDETITSIRPDEALMKQNGN